MANLVSLFRMLLGFLAAGMLFYPSQRIYWMAFALTIIVIWMDGLDGYVARKFNETSKAGAVIDILGDRVVEMTYWIVFATLGWIPVWMTLLVMTRGIVVDGFRSMAMEQGFTAFGTSSMMQTRWGVFFTSSRPSRWLYAVFKAIAFCLMIVTFMPDAEALPGYQTISLLTWISVYITLFFCVVRGLPVLIESRRFL